MSKKEHNHIKKIKRLVAKGKIPLTAGLAQVHVLHDGKCGLRIGKRCNCDPSIRYTPPRGKSPLASTWDEFDTATIDTFCALLLEKGDGQGQSVPFMAVDNLYWMLKSRAKNKKGLFEDITCLHNAAALAGAIEMMANGHNNSKVREMCVGVQRAYDELLAECAKANHDDELFKATYEWAKRRHEEVRGMRSQNLPLAGVPSPDGQKVSCFNAMLLLVSMLSVKVAGQETTFNELAWLLHEAIKSLLFRLYAAGSADGPFDEVQKITNINGRENCLRVFEDWIPAFGMLANHWNPSMRAAGRALVAEAEDSLKCLESRPALKTVACGLRQRIRELCDSGPANKPSQPARMNPDWLKPSNN